MPESLESRVARFCERHRLLGPEVPVLIMVSGGPDSTCLLHVLAAIHDGRLGVVTVDHGLRPESAGEAEAAVGMAQALGLAARIVRLDLERGPGLQERAREARIAVAEAAAREGGYERVATGHTVSDQAETILFRLARGTGRAGALGMAPRRGLLVRPLLEVTRGEALAYCRRRSLPVVFDPSNADRQFARTRVRDALLPDLEAVHPGAARNLARLAGHLRDEAAVLEEVVEAAWERCRAGEGLDVRRLAAETPAMRALVVRRVAGTALSALHTGRILALAKRGGRPIELPGAVAAVDRGVLVIEAQTPPPPEPRPLAVPGQVAWGDALVAAAAGPAAPPSPGCVSVATVGPLEVRSPRAGDRLALGGGGHQAVGRLLAAAGVPARRRPYVPVVATAGRVVWVAGYRADPELLAAPGSSATVLELR